MQKDAWNRIEAWLAKNAPKLIGNLNPGATGAEIAETEQATGITFPESFRKLYRQHNGLNDDDNSGSLFFGMNFLTLEGVQQNHALRVGSPDDSVPVRSADPGIDLADIFNPKWIPFAHDFGECLLCVDTSPGQGGTVGQVVFVDGAAGVDTVILVASSLDDFLSEFADNLESGKHFLNADALEEGNEFLDCVKDIDIVNWSRSPKWKHLDR